MRKSFVIMGMLITAFILVAVLGCGNNKAESLNERTCLANQRNFLTASDIFASETGQYPNAPTIAAHAIFGGLGPNKGAWPADYYNGSLTDNAPTCPSGGTVTVTYDPLLKRPTTSCSKHGSP